MSNTIEIPRYQCHKQVRALKIKLAIMNPRGVELHFDDERYCPIEMPIEYARKHTNAQGVQALAGGYVVWYEDGYASWSPAEPFENGYVRIGDTPVAVTCNGAAYSSPEVAYAAAEEAEALSMVLDEAGIPRSDEHGVTYSLWGRVSRLIEKRCQQMVAPIARMSDSQLADLKAQLKASKGCGHVMPMMTPDSYDKISDALENPPPFNEEMQSAIEKSRSRAIKVSMDLGNDPRQDGEQVED